MSESTRHSPLELIVVGHVARDFIQQEERLGGAAAFAARAAACLHVPTGVITAVPPGFDLLTPLQNDPYITLLAHDSPEETGFVLDYSGPVRRIHLKSRARSLMPSDVPQAMRDAPVAYVAPVIGECDRSLVDILNAKHIIVGAQGWMRGVNADGLIVPTLSDEIAHPPKGLSAVIFSELDHPDAQNIAAHLAQTVGVVALTRGARGVSLITRDSTTEVPAAPALEKDPTGAGDVFGIVFGLALHRGQSTLEAAHLAALAAARVVEGPGLGNLSQFRKDF